MNMLEIKLFDDDDFLKIRETLTRIGIANNKEKILYQSCHILQKQGKFYICHFKELLRLDGREVHMTQEDTDRRCDIAALIEDWGLCQIIEREKHEFKGSNFFRVISHRDKKNWELRYKYKVGS